MSVATLGLAASGALSHFNNSVTSSVEERAAVPAQAAIETAPPRRYSALLDSTPAVPDAAKAWGSAPLGSAFQTDASTAQASAPADRERPQPLPAPLEPQLAQAASDAPLPPPRPAGLGGPNLLEPARLADRNVTQQAKSEPVPAPADDKRSIFDKLFGAQTAQKPAGTVLAYAPTDGGAASPPLGRLAPAPAIGGAGTAVYDISARTVTLPNGERLEAHSGLGEKMDDPRHVNVRMQGATPPGTYDLTEREQLFHGVRALRLNPVGGSAAVYGRTGLLTHTYLLGPSGASNGCVSFKDYDKFLQAYLRGEVRRIVVVSGRGQDGPPGFANRLFGMLGGSAGRGDF